MGADPSSQPVSTKGSAGDKQTSNSVDSSYLEKILAYIPATLNAAYVAAIGLLQTEAAGVAWLHWAVFLSLWALTPLYVIYMPTKQAAQQNNSRYNAIASTVAFAVWAYAINGGPIAVSFPSFYKPIYGSLLLIVTTLAVPILETAASKFSFFQKKDPVAQG